MLKRITMRNKSIFLSWVIAYASILIIPLVISSIVYYNSGKTLEREIVRANESLLNQIQYVMDSKLRELNRLGVELDFNSYVTELINTDLKVESWRRFSTFKLVGDLRIYNISNDFVSDLFIYFKGNDLILSPTGSNESRDYYDIHLKNIEITFEEWSKLINGKFNGNFIPIGEDRKLIYIKSLPILEPKESFANLIITINNVFFQQTIRNTKWLEKGNVYILNKNEEILFATNTEENTLKYMDLKNGNGFMRRKINGKNVIAAYATSVETDWKYISVIPEEILWEKAEYVRRLTMISFPLCILLGGMTAFFFLRKNYKPISDLTHELATRAGVGFNLGMNEYLFIREAMTKTLKEKEEIAQTLEQQRISQRSSFILNLLKGRLEGLKYIHESLSFFDINFTSDSFAVVLINIKDCSNIFYNSANLEGKDKVEFAHYIIKNIVEEMICRKNKGYIVESDGMLICLVNIDDIELAGAKEDIYRSICEGQSFINSKFNIDITAVISNIHSNIFGISEAYQESLQLMEYKLVMGIQKIISYDDIPHEENTKYQYSLETEQRLINYIKVGEFQYAKELLENIIDSSFEKYKVSFKFMKCLMFDIVNTLLRVSGDAHLQFNDMERILECKTLEEMKGEILKVLKKACDNINKFKQSKNKNGEMIERAIQLIENKYMEENLNISFIADQLDITPDYLSRIFKNHTGEAMLDYINRIRLQRAKELLVKKESNIAEVAKKTGFSNVNTFIRIFKKHEGVTPGQYKTLDI